MTEPIQNDADYQILTQEFRGKLLAAAREAQMSAYAPYSNFPVGAAVLLTDGTIYHGCNIENASFGLTVCAERVAVFSAVSDGRLDIVAVAVVTGAPRLSKPCGACRQVIAEFSQSDNPIVIISAQVTGEAVTETITDLLPDNFNLLLTSPPDDPAFPISGAGGITLSANEQGERRIRMRTAGGS